MEFIIITILLLLPVIIEGVVIDPLYWKDDKPDKPGSNWIRGLMYASLAVIMDWGMNYNWWYMNLILGIALNFMTFGYLINLMRNKEWDYLSDKGFDKYFKKFVPYPHVRLFIQFMVLVVTMVVYYTVTGDINQGHRLPVDIPIYSR